MNRSDSCDFCYHGSAPYWVYPASEFPMIAFEEITDPRAHRLLGLPAGEEHMSRGGWLACGGCRSFVERADLVGLAGRVGRGYKRQGMTWLQDEEAALRLIWTRFLDHRTGEAVLLDDLRASCEHSPEIRRIGTKNDRATGEQYMVVHCSVCGVEFPDLPLEHFDQPVSFTGEHRTRRS